MSASSEYLIKIREWADEKGHDRDQWGDWEWPAPPEYTEYEVTGTMRDDIVAVADVDPASVSKVRMIIGHIEGGWSEFTVDHDYPIEVWVDLPSGPREIYSEDYGYTREMSLARFLKWLRGELK